MNPLTWYPHDVVAWQLDERVRRLGYLERGVYHDLLMHQWVEGSIPADVPGVRGVLSRPDDSAVTDDILLSVLHFFPVAKRIAHARPTALALLSLPPGGRRANVKLAAIRERRLATYQRKARNAKVSARKRIGQLAKRAQSESLSESLSTRSTPHKDPPQLDVGSHNEIVVTTRSKEGEPRLKGEQVQGNGTGKLPAVRRRPTCAAKTAEQVQLDLAAALAAAGTGEVVRQSVRELQSELVFAYWGARLHHKGARMDPKRDSRIQDRLVENDGNVHELLYVVDGARRDPNLMGKNETQTPHNGIETLFRDRGQVERLAALGGYEPGKTHKMAERYLGLAAT